MVTALAHKTDSEPSAALKQTELGLIPDNWKIVTVDDVCRLVNGRGFKPFEWSRRGPPIIRIQNLNGSTDFNFYDGPYDRKIEVGPGQLLFAWSGSRGTSFGPHIWPGPLGLLNYHTWKIVIDETSVSPSFLFHALKGLTEFIEGQAHGASALVHVQKWQMEAFQLAIPETIGEQDAIAEALSDADALIESLDALIAKKRAIKQGVMQGLLSGRKRLPGFSDKWKEKRIGDLAEVDPENLGSGTAPNFGFNYIALEDVDQGVLLSFSERLFGSAPSRARRRLRNGDILFGTVRPNLKSHFHFDRQVGDWVCSTGFCVIRCTPLQADPSFIFNHLFADRVSQQIELLISGSNYPAVSSRDVAALEIPCPDYKEQLAISEALSSMRNEVAALEMRLSKARQLKRGMMQELLTGRVRLV